MNPRRNPDQEEPAVTALVGIGCDRPSGIEADAVEPTNAELDDIDAEWPVIAAELDLLDVQLAIMDGVGPMDEFEVRRLRHARRAVIRATLAYAQHLANARRAA